jgi:Mrp family chromosome partitioning ATPase
MSKMRETLRQSNGTPSAAPAVAVPAIALEELADGEEMNFIEVGPRRSFEASPAVLAAIPAQRGPGAAQSAPAAPPSSQPSTLPRPHNVLFRSLTVPSRLAPELVAFHAPANPASARFTELLESLLGAVLDKGGSAPTALLFSGVRSGIGATTALLNVAITAARQGLRVVVLDANLRRPAVATLLGLESAPGLTEVLAEEHTVEQALRATEQADLSVLTAGSPTPTIIGSEALLSLLEQLRNRFDLVLIDGPRWDGKAGVTALAAACEAVFLVVPCSEADKAPASELVQTLPRQGVRLAGCVLTGD